MKLKQKGEGRAKVARLFRYYPREREESWTPRKKKRRLWVEPFTSFRSSRRRGWERRREQRSDETSRWHRAREICTTKTNDDDDDDADEFLPVRFHHLETPRGWELRRSSNGEV